MTVFKEITMPAEAIETAEKVYVPGTGTGRYTVPTGLYNATIEEAYIRESQSSQAKALYIRIKTDTGRYVDEAFWVTNKQGQSTYERDGVKKALPSYNRVSQLAELLTGKEMRNLKFEAKMVADRSYGADDGALKTVEVATELVGKQIGVGIIEAQEYKKTKDGSGQWVNSDQTKTVNEMDKFYDSATGRTLQEINARAPAKNKDEWMEKVGSLGLIDRTKRKSKK